MVTTRIPIFSAIGWATSDEVISCADDHILMRWNLVSGENSALATLPDTLFPTDVHWFPRGLAGGAKKGGASDLFILTSAEGIEKTRETRGLFG